MIVLSEQEVAALLPMQEAIEVVDQTMRAVSRGGAELPLRFAMPVGGGNFMGVMPGALAAPACYGIKLVSLFPGNPARGLSSHRGAILLFEAETGGAVAMMDAGLLTAIRTAAASAVATRALARADAAQLALIGHGEQAWHHLAAMAAVRPLRAVSVAGRDGARAQAFAERAKQAFPALSFTHGTSVEEAVAGADIICTVTAAPRPILQGAWLREGAHLNVVGASMADKREVDDAVVARSAVWVDYLPSALAQAGEIVDMIKAGRLQESELMGEIGALLNGDIPGREDGGQITLYRSLGVAAQDLACAWHVLGRARASGAGQEVAL